MKRIFKYTYLSLMAIVALALNACTSDYEYDGATAEGEQVYFSNELASKVETPATASSFDVTINRINTKGSLIVPVTATMSDGSIYTLATSNATFNDGESETKVTFTYDPSDIVYGTYYDINLSISDSQYTTIYGNSSYSFQAGLTEWEDYGTGSYREDILTTFFGVDNYVFDVEIQKSVLTEGRYRVKNVYTTLKNPIVSSDGASVDDGIVIDSDDHWMIVDASDPNYVYIEGGETGLDVGYGEVSTTSMVSYYLAKGNSLDDLKASYPGLFGTLKDGVITMPTKSMLIGMADYNDGAMYYANGSGLFAIALPGSVIADYSLSFSTTGTYIDVASNEYSCGTFTFGTDITSVKYALTTDDSQIDAIAEGIIDGSVESTELSAAGDVQIPMDGTATYYLVVVGYNGSEAVTSTYYTIKFKSTKDNAEQWNALYEGVYTYNVQALQDGASSYFDGDDDAILYQSASDATRFRIAPWGNSEDGLIFTKDSETGEFCVDAVDTGANYQGEEIYASCYTALTGKTSYPCGFDSENSNVINFILFYHISSGNGFGVVLETFEITGTASATANVKRMFKPSYSIKKNMPKLKRQFKVKPTAKVAAL